MRAENSVGRRLFNLDLMFIETRAHWQAKSRLLFKYEITEFISDVAIFP